MLEKARYIQQVVIPFLVMIMVYLLMLNLFLMYTGGYYCLMLLGRRSLRILGQQDPNHHGCKAGDVPEDLQEQHFSSVHPKFQ